jgi:ArsR family transcriptional regulator
MANKICSNCFNLLEVPARQKIILNLKKGPQMATKILKDFSLRQPTVSYHLRVLEKSGMISSKKLGRKIFYFLNKKYPCKGCSIFKIPFKYA